MSRIISPPRPTTALHILGYLAPGVVRGPATFGVDKVVGNDAVHVTVVIVPVLDKDPVAVVIVPVEDKGPVAVVIVPVVDKGPVAVVIVPVVDKSPVAVVIVPVVYEGPAVVVIVSDEGESPDNDKKQKECNISCN